MKILSKFALLESQVVPGKVNQWLIKIKVLLLTNLFAIISGYELSHRSGNPISVSGIVIVL